MMIPAAQPVLRTRRGSRLLTLTAAACITGYQRYVSPYKGFRCAHRVHFQGESCSQYVKRIVLEEGLLSARAKARQRFAECKEAHLALRASAESQAAYAELGWLTSLSQHVPAAQGFCIPFPIGCCYCSF